MRLLRTSSAWLLAITLMGAGHAQAGRPQVFWASDPVRPNETVLLQGSDFGAAPVVEVSRLPDGNAAEPAADDPRAWRRAEVFQAGDSSLKLMLPADWKMGAYACRVTAGEATSAPVAINVPDPWWIQGDRGDSATPGGWLRVFGKSLHFTGPSLARLQPEQGAAVVLQTAAADCFALRFALPTELAQGTYTVSVHNDFGGASAGAGPAKCGSNARSPGRRRSSACWIFTARMQSPKRPKRCPSTVRCPTAPRAFKPR